MKMKNVKYFAAENGKKIVDEALQIFGGLGYMRDCPIEMFYRNIRATTIYEGTSAIQLSIIAKFLI